MKFDDAIPINNNWKRRKKYILLFWVLNQWQENIKKNRENKIHIINNNNNFYIDMKFILFVVVDVVRSQRVHINSPKIIIIIFIWCTECRMPYCWPIFPWHIKCRMSILSTREYQRASHHYNNIHIRYIIYFIRNVSFCLLNFNIFFLFQMLIWRIDAIIYLYMYE